MNTNNAYKLFHNGSLALARAERQGIRIDLDQANQSKKDLTELIGQLDAEVHETKFYRHWSHSVGGKEPNLESSDQLQKFLYGTKKLTPVKTTPSGRGSTDEEALEALNIPELTKMLRIRKLKKMRDTYLDAFLRESHNGYIHPSFNLHLVKTFRSSSDSPNFQNIPVRDEEAKAIIRKCLLPRPGHQLLEVDYGALEVRIAACYHKDPTMLKYIKDKYDMHGDMAEQIFLLGKYDKTNKAHKTLRNGAKNGFVFPQFYGDYYGNNAIDLSKWGKLPLKGKWKDGDGIPLTDKETLGRHLRDKGILSLKSFTQHLKEIEEHFWNTRFPVYSSWKKKWYREYQKNGYFDLHTGFRIGGVMGKNEVINYPVQGAAFHCLLWSFNEADRIMVPKWDTKLIGQIHDSILFDVHPDELEQVMTTVKRITCEDLVKEWKWIIVPLEIEAELCEIDQSWYHKKEVPI
jgi:DNA polymerase-1